MAKNWTITLTSSSVLIKETSQSPTSSTIFSGPIGVNSIVLSHNNQYDIADHNYIIIKSYNTVFKLDYNADTISPATGSNSVETYITKLGRYMNGDSTVSF